MRARTHHSTARTSTYGEFDADEPYSRSELLAGERVRPAAGPHRTQGYAAGPPAPDFARWRLGAARRSGELVGMAANCDRRRVFGDGADGAWTGWADVLTRQHRADNETSHPRPTASDLAGTGFEQDCPRCGCGGNAGPTGNDSGSRACGRRATGPAIAATDYRSCRPPSGARGGRRPSPGAVARPAGATFTGRLSQCRHRHSEGRGRDTRQRRVRLAPSAQARARPFSGALRGRRRP